MIDVGNYYEEMGAEEVEEEEEEATSSIMGDGVKMERWRWKRKCLILKNTDGGKCTRVGGGGGLRSNQPGWRWSPSMWLNVERKAEKDF